MSAPNGEVSAPPLLCDSPPPCTLADILQLLVYTRDYPAYKRRIDDHFPPVMSASQAHSRMQYAALNCPQYGRLAPAEAAKLPLYRRLMKEARWEYNADLDVTSFGCLVGDIADAAGVPYDTALAMTVDEFGKLMDRWEGAEGDEAPADEPPPARPRGRGRRPAAEATPERMEQDIKLYQDWQASGLSKKEFLHERRIPEEDGIKSLDRGEYHAKKPGNKSDE